MTETTAFRLFGFLEEEEKIGILDLVEAYFFDEDVERIQNGEMTLSDLMHYVFTCYAPDIFIHAIENDTEGWFGFTEWSNGQRTSKTFYEEYQKYLNGQPRTDQTLENFLDSIEFETILSNCDDCWADLYATEEAFKSLGEPFTGKLFAEIKERGWNIINDIEGVKQWVSTNAIKP